MATYTKAENLLVRNYDYPPLLCDTTVLASAFNGTRVMAMSDCVWGALDGVNEHGLSVAIAFGGRQVVGEGFGIGLVIRYILEFARTVPKARHDASSNTRAVVVQRGAWLMRRGRSAIAYIAPDRKLKVSKAPSVANRQGRTEWPEHAAFCDTVSREEAMASALGRAGDHGAGLDRALSAGTDISLDCDQYLGNRLHRRLRLQPADARTALARRPLVPVVGRVRRGQSATTKPGVGTAADV